MILPRFTHCSFIKNKSVANPESVLKIYSATNKHNSRSVGIKLYTLTFLRLVRFLDSELDLFDFDPEHSSTVGAGSVKGVSLLFGRMHGREFSSALGTLQGSSHSVAVTPHRSPILFMRCYISCSAWAFVFSAFYSSFCVFFPIFVPLLGAARRLRFQRGSLAFGV